LIVQKCNNASKKPGEKRCKSDKEINQWIQDVSVMVFNELEYFDSNIYAKRPVVKKQIGISFCLLDHNRPLRMYSRLILN